MRSVSRNGCDAFGSNFQAIIDPMVAIIAKSMQSLVMKKTSATFSGEPEFKGTSRALGLHEGIPGKQCQFHQAI